MTVEWVVPELAHDREADPDAATTAEAFTARLQGHLLDLAGYRRQLARVRRLTTH